jgi:hypothetical protein
MRLLDEDCNNIELIPSGVAALASTACVRFLVCLEGSECGAV